MFGRFFSKHVAKHEATPVLLAHVLKGLTEPLDSPTSAFNGSPSPTYALVLKYGTAAGADTAWSKRQQNALPDEAAPKPTSDDGKIGPNVSMTEYNKKFADPRALGTDNKKDPEQSSKVQSLKNEILDNLAKTNAEGVAEIKELTIRAQGEPTSKSVYTDDNGQYTKMSTHFYGPGPNAKLVTETRQQLHDRIISEYINEKTLAAAKPAPGTQPTFVVLGGRGGSGKSKFTDENTILKDFDPSNFIKIDSDEIKNRLRPPYAGWNAYSVHDEASDIFDTMTDLLKTNGVNFIQDITMKSMHVEHAIQSAKAGGYDVQGHYMYLPPQTAALRAQTRFLGKDGKRGRLVPADVVLRDMQRNEIVFDSLKKYFSKWSAWDNQGKAPELLGRKGY